MEALAADVVITADGMVAVLLVMLAFELVAEAAVEVLVTNLVEVVCAEVVGLDDVANDLPVATVVVSDLLIISI
jgi:hypothetical protein